MTMTNPYPIAESSLRPHAVPLKKARELLGNKAISEIYSAGGRGELEFLKDGHKTLVTLASIERYMHGLPPARIKQLPPRPRRPA
jgi:hypothetical protein